MRENKLIVTRAPHMVAKLNTTVIMRDTILALFPGFIAASVYFGRAAFFRVAASVALCVAFEWLTRRILKRKQTVRDFSAAVSGMIFAFLLPANVPYKVIVIGCFTAIVIVKQLFGGLGQNFVNPAALAWVAMLICFPSEMTVEGTPIELYTNAMLLPSNLRIFLGPVGGYIGEVSGITILLGGIYLILRKVIEPTIPLSYIITIVIVSLVWGLDPIFHILAGGVFLGAFLMATDPVTTPAFFPGKIIFGIGCGFFTMVMRIFCTFPNSVPFAILLMNMFTPHIDRFMRYLFFKRSDAYEKL